MDFKKRLRQISVFMVLLLFLASSFISVNGENLNADNISKKTWDNIDYVLYQLLNEEDKSEFARNHNLFYKEGKVRVILKTQNGEIKSTGMEIETRQGSLIQALAPVDNLVGLSKNKRVLHIRKPQSAHPLEPEEENVAENFPYFLPLLGIGGTVLGIFIGIYWWRAKYR